MRLALIDAHSLAHRAMGQNGPATAAQRFFSLLGGIFVELQPTHILLCLDNPREDLWRTSVYPKYKGNRRPKDDQVREFLRTLFNACEKMGLATSRIEQWEADDVMGSQAWGLADQFEQVFLCTPDKDMAQLVAGNVAVYDYPTKVVRDEGAVFDVFGVGPGQIPDYLALVGDRIDGLPGVRGVGPVKARRLLDEYGTLDGIVQGGALGPLDQEEEELLTLIEDLATIRTDLPTVLDEGRSLEELEVRPLDLSAAKEELVALKARIGIMASRYPVVS
jgi:5'-3' exonuclease